jgi:hypothetical protein
MSCTAVLAAAILSLAVAACGGSAHPAGTTTKASTTTATNSSSSSSSHAVSVTTGPVHATLVATTHQPVAGKNWPYTVTATDAQGHPLSGTVETEFAFGGAVVGKEAPAIHALGDGRMKDMFKFPAKSVGYPLEVRLVVRTPKGSATLNWPVTVHK